MKIVAKPKAKVKDKKFICPFCGEDKPFIHYIKKGILNRVQVLLTQMKVFISAIPVEHNGLIKKVNL